MTKLFDPTLFFNKKEYCSCEIAATHAGFGHVQVGMATKYLFWFYTWLAISASCELDKSLKSFSDAAIRQWEMHVLYNPDGIVKYSVIHRLRFKS